MRTWNTRQAAVRYYVCILFSHLLRLVHSLNVFFPYWFIYYALTYDVHINIVLTQRLQWYRSCNIIWLWQLTLLTCTDGACFVRECSHVHHVTIINSNWQSYIGAESVLAVDMKHHIKLHKYYYNTILSSTYYGISSQSNQKQKHTSYRALHV